MPDTGFLFLSLASLVIGAAMILFPDAVLGASEFLNRTMQVLDKPLMRHRHLVGFVTFAASYAFFKIALWLPALRY